MRLQDTTCLVTGASSGVGRAVASCLSARGARLLLTGKDAGRLREVGLATGGATFAADLSVIDMIERLADWVLREGPPQLVVHNAGMGLVGAAEDLQPGQLQRLLNVNLVAPVELTRRLLPAMGRGPGRLVFVTSIAGVLGVSHESSYAASKAALQVYADSLRPELATRGIGVTTCVPGVVDTDFFIRRGRAYDRAFPRPMSVERVAGALIEAIEKDRDTLVLPRWLRVPIALHAALPGLYDRLANRWS